MSSYHSTGSVSEVSDNIYSNSPASAFLQNAFSKQIGSSKNNRTFSINDSLSSAMNQSNGGASSENEGSPDYGSNSGHWSPFQGTQNSPSYFLQAGNYSSMDQFQLTSGPVTNGSHNMKGKQFSTYRTQYEEWKQPQASTQRKLHNKNPSTDDNDAFNALLKQQEDDLVRDLNLDGRPHNNFSHFPSTSTSFPTHAPGASAYHPSNGSNSFDNLISMERHRASSIGGYPTHQQIQPQQPLFASHMPPPIYTMNSFSMHGSLSFPDFSTMSPVMVPSPPVSSTFFPDEETQQPQQQQQQQQLSANFERMSLQQRPTAATTTVPRSSSFSGPTTTASASTMQHMFHQLQNQQQQQNGARKTSPRNGHSQSNIPSPLSSSPINSSNSFGSAPNHSMMKKAFANNSNNNATNSTLYPPVHDNFLSKWSNQSKDTQAAYQLRTNYLSGLYQLAQKFQQQGISTKVLIRKKKPASQLQQPQPSQEKTGEELELEEKKVMESDDSSSRGSEDDLEEELEEDFLAPSAELLRTLKHSIRQNVPLTRLSICHAKLNDIHLNVLIEAILKTHHLQLVEILLNHNQITNEGAKALVKQCVPRLPSLTSIELFGNKLTDDCCIEMSQLLMGQDQLKHLQLKRLKLGDNEIGPEGALQLANGLKNNTTLTQLHLGGNKIMAEGLQHLSNIALMHNSTLTSLGLRDNLVQALGMKYLAQALQQSCCNLSDIQLKGNEIGSEGAKFLAKALLTNRSLKVLELQSNNIGALGTKYLCEALEKNTSVHALNFNDNSLCDEGVEYISKLLQKNGAITTLGLANNKIRKRGAIALAQALDLSHSENKCAVTGLDLGSNELSNGGAIALSEALKNNHILTSLDLRSCEIHLKGILAIADMVNYNHTLRHLDLGANYSKNSGAQAFGEVLQKNTTLTRLCLTDNQIYQEGGEALCVGLQSNYTLRNFSYGGQGPLANRIDSSVRKIIDSIINENKRHFETLQQSENTDENIIVKPFMSNNQYRFVPIPKLMQRIKAQPSNENSFSNSSLMMQQQQDNAYSMNGSSTAHQNNYYSNHTHSSTMMRSQQPTMMAMDPRVNSLVQGTRNQRSNSTGSMRSNSNNNNSNTLSQNDLPTWFTQHPNSHTNSALIQNALSKLDAKLEFLFQNNCLKAENPKFKGCYFIGNILNTLKKIFPDLEVLDEVQLVRFAYSQPHKYQVHLSREMVKTQIKYTSSQNDFSIPDTLSCNDTTFEFKRLTSF